MKRVCKHQRIDPMETLDDIIHNYGLGGLVGVTDDQTMQFFSSVLVFNRELTKDRAPSITAQTTVDFKEFAPFYSMEDKITQAGERLIWSTFTSLVAEEGAHEIGELFYALKSIGEHSALLTIALPVRKIVSIEECS